MSWLFIDTHERGQVRLALLPVSGRIRERYVARRQSPAVAVASFVSPAATRALTGVCVVQGPGPFSVIRSGVLTGNMIARMRNLPLVGVGPEEATHLPRLRDQLVAGVYAARSYVAPVYDADPNIGPPAL